MNISEEEKSKAAKDFLDLIKGGAMTVQDEEIFIITFIWGVNWALEQCKKQV